MRQQGQSDPLAVPQLGVCASSGRAWRLRAARHSQEETSPLGAPPCQAMSETKADKAWVPARPKRRVGRGWPEPGAASGMLWR